MANMSYLDCAILLVVLGGVFGSFASVWNLAFVSILSSAIMFLIERRTGSDWPFWLLRALEGGALVQFGYFFGAMASEWRIMVRDRMTVPCGNPSCPLIAAARDAERQTASSQHPH